MSGGTGMLSAASAALGLLLAGIALTMAWDGLLAGRVAGGRWRAGAALGPFREALRLLLKEFRPTERPDLPLWLSAPVLLLALVMAALVVLPLGPARIAADLSVGVVYLTAMLALTIVAVFLAGWGPNSKYPLIGGYRFVGLALAYEMPFAITVIAVALPAESLSVQAIVAVQQQALWNVWLQPLGFLIYLLCACAIAFWGPFGMPQGTDLAGGVELELGGAPLLVWRLGQHALLLTTAAFAVPLFLGGGAGPWLPPPVWTVVKTLLVAALLVGLRHWVAQLRLPGFMFLAWVGLIPLSLFNLFLVGLILLLWPEPFGGRP